MEFSPSLSCSRGLVEWSPNGSFLAHVVQTRLVIRDAVSLKVISSHCCLDQIDLIRWSPNSEFVAASVLPLATTHVFSPADEDWTAKITEGPVGLSDISFSPDGRHLLAMSDFKVKLTIWSLISKQVRYIKLPVFFAFSPDGTNLAVVERSTSHQQQLQQTVAIYDEGGGVGDPEWHELNRFQHDCSFEDDQGGGILWQHKDRILLWSGCLQFLFQVFSPGGQLLYSYFAEEANSAGYITSVAWSPCGQLLVTGGHDRSVRVFNALNFTLFATFYLSEEALCATRDHFVTRDCVVFEERDKKRDQDDVDGNIVKDWLGTRETYYDCVTTRPIRLSSTKRPLPPKKASEAGDPNSQGVSRIKFSPNSHFLALAEDSMPATLWIWSVQDVKLSTVLVQQDPITSFSWEPAYAHAQLPRLVLTTSSAQGISLWTPLGAVRVRVPVPVSSDPSKTNESSGLFKALPPPTSSSSPSLPAATWNTRGRSLCLVWPHEFVCSRMVSRPQIHAEV